MDRPNILHLFTDQQRFDTIRALGAGWMKTPALDRLCREGTVFTRAYTPSPECVPARACMITGRYADQTGCGSNADLMPPEDSPTLMSLLADAGYRTHGVGKCHFNPDPWSLRGFHRRDTAEEIAEDPARDDFLRSLARSPYAHVLEPHGPRGEMYYIPQVSQLPAEAHPTRWVADRSLDFIRSRAGKKQPWYLYAGFIHPHPPFAPPNPWHKLYRAPEMPLPDLPADADELLFFINRFQNRYKYRDRGLDLNLVCCIRAYYYACVSFIDHQVGRLLTELETSGELDRTLIVFTADHGEMLGDLGCFGKRSAHDASLRVPLIARLPGRFAPGERCAAPASLVDLLPTFLCAAGAPVPANADGMDLSALATGQRRGAPVFFHYARGENAILGAVEYDWKYAWSAPDQKEFLFRCGEGTETKNHASTPAAAHVRDTLGVAVRRRAALSPYYRPNLTARGTWRRAKPRRMPADPDAGLLYQDPPKARPVLPAAYGLVYPKENFLGF